MDYINLNKGKVDIKAKYNKRDKKIYNDRRSVHQEGVQT